MYKLTETKLVCERWATATKANMSKSEKRSIRREGKGVYEM